MMEKRVEQGLLGISQDLDELPLQEQTGSVNKSRKYFMET